MSHHYSTSLGVSQKNNTNHFDRSLSLAIDAAHDALNALSYQYGLRVWCKRFYLRRQLRKLEARVPR